MSYTSVGTLLQRMQEANAAETKEYLKEAKVRIDPQTGVIRRPVPVRPSDDHGQTIQRSPLTIKGSKP